VLVNRRAAAGDYEGASKASRMARRWCLISVVVAAIVLVALASGAVKNPYTSN
jgi:Na+-driven multidrug efflux pump